MGYKLVLKDAKYYEDLIYLVKKARLGHKYNNDFTDSRIKRRTKGEVIEDDLPTEGCSAFFESELVDLLSDMYSNTEVAGVGLSDISKYPKLADKAIEELNRRRSENHMLRCLATIVKEMGSLSELHFGEPTGTGFYINKGEKGWESIIAERHSPWAEITIYRKSFESCRAACNDVIDLLADYTNNRVGKRKVRFSNLVKTLRKSDTIL